MATPTTQDARAEQALSGAVDTMMAAATTEKPAALKPTGITLTVDAADRTALTRAQATALNRARLALNGPFDVSVAWAHPKRPARARGLRVARRPPRKPRGTGTEARTVRASLPEWASYRVEAAEAGLALNTWLRLTLNDGAQLARTLRAMEAREQQRRA